MKHKHHIKQRYKGGTDDASNIVTLTPIQHAMWHYAEWMREGDMRDYCAYKMILGDVKNPEFRSARAKAFGSANGKRCHILHPHLAHQNGVRNNKIQRARLAQQGKTIAEKQWIVITPDGDELHITNLAKYCRENNLCKSHLCNVAKGKRKHHKGYTIKQAS